MLLLLNNHEQLTVDIKRGEGVKEKGGGIGKRKKKKNRKKKLREEREDDDDEREGENSYNGLAACDGRRLSVCYQNKVQRFNIK